MSPFRLKEHGPRKARALACYSKTLFGVLPSLLARSPRRSASLGLLLGISHLSFVHPPVLQHHTIHVKQLILPSLARTAPESSGSVPIIFAQPRNFSILPPISGHPPSIGWLRGKCGLRFVLVHKKGNFLCPLLRLEVLLRWVGPILRCEGGHKQNAASKVAPDAASDLFLVCFLL